MCLEFAKAREIIQTSLTLDSGKFVDLIQTFGPLVSFSCHLVLVLWIFNKILKFLFFPEKIVTWVGRQTRWWPRDKAIYFSWLGPELFCLLLGPPGFNCWFYFAPVFQWCCSAPRGSPGVGRNMFLSSPHLCFIIVFICDLFVSRDDPLMS